MSALLVLMSKVNQLKVQKACFVILHSGGKNVFSGGLPLNVTQFENLLYSADE